MKRQDFIEKSKRIVVKVGTSILTTDTGRIDDRKISGVVAQLADLSEKGYEVLLVSSGSIAAGVEALSLKSVPKGMPELQASASVGQGLLAHKYADLFKQNGITVGQVLLTRHDTTHRQQYVNAKNTLNKLLELGVIPVINENDSTSVEEIKFGDNDNLAALVANIVEADLLIILSDVDGLFSGDPKSGSTEFISEVEEITENIVGVAGGSGTAFGKGGMETKISAAKMATAGRTGVIIANGHKDNILSNILNGQEAGTFFVPKKKKISARKLWILNRPAKGTVVVDDGAGKAICDKGRSLLAVGVIDAEGKYDIGEVVNVEVKGKDGQPIVKGITNYSSEEIGIIAGKKYNEVIKLLNSEASEEVIHRDDMVIVKEGM